MRARRTARFPVRARRPDEKQEEPARGRRLHGPHFFEGEHASWRDVVMLFVEAKLLRFTSCGLASTLQCSEVESSRQAQATVRDNFVS